MKIKFSVSMGLVGCKREEVREYDEEEYDLATMSEKDRAIFLDEEWEEWSRNEVDGGWDVVED